MILFAWSRLTPPGFIGGAEITEGLWASFFASLGHRVRFIGSAESPRDQGTKEQEWLLRLLTHAGINYTQKDSQITYTWRGVECCSASQAELVDLTRNALAERPVLLWTSQERCDEIAALARPVGIPVSTYIHSVSEVGLLSAAIGARFVFAPSVFVQRTAHSRTGTASFVLRPTIETTVQAPCKYALRREVLFVNPIPEKGLEVALLLARHFPDREFVFVESWSRFDLGTSNLLPNVRLLPRQPSLGELYARACLLIAPSVIPDAAPRVISEAGLHGVPVVGSRSGGIPELVCNSVRNCISVGNIRGWVSRLRELLYDEEAWERASQAQISFTRGLADNPTEAFDRSGVLEAIL